MNVVLIAGSRAYAHLDVVRQVVSTIVPGSVVISGGARGVDAVAVAEARRLGLATHVYPADWQRYGKRAGLLRNAVLVQQAHEAIVFSDGVSRGTQHTLALLDAARKPYLLFGADGTLRLIVGVNDYRVAVTPAAPVVDLSEGDWLTGWVDLPDARHGC